MTKHSARVVGSGWLFAAVTLASFFGFAGCTRPPGVPALIPKPLPHSEKILGNIDVRVRPGWVQQAATFAWRDADYRQAIEDSLLAAGVSSRERSHPPMELTVSIYQVDLTTGRTKTTAGIYADWTLDAVERGARRTVHRFLGATEAQVPDSGTRVADAIAAASRQSIATAVARLAALGEGAREGTPIRVRARSTVNERGAERWVHVLHAAVANRLQDEGYTVLLDEQSPSAGQAYDLEIVLSSLDDVGETQRAILGVLAGSAKIGLSYRIRAADGAEVADGTIDSESKAGFLWDQIADSTTVSASRAVSEQIVRDVLSAVR